MDFEMARRDLLLMRGIFSDRDPCVHRLAILVSAVSLAPLLTHSATIGTTFRVLEMQIIILALLENFEFSFPPQNEKTKIYRKPTQTMLPMAEGENGAWMGLLIKTLHSDRM